MRKKSEKGTHNKSKLLVGFSVAVFVSFMLSFFLGENGILRLREMQQEQEALKEENFRIAIENRDRLKEIRALKQNPAAIERIAREELHFVSPNDLVLTVPE